ncbi:hypothetical protein FRC96_13690 [Lujinxingia vulgaris]|uniref:Uncharacterized protein n=1 Tax=Lujinxingia vulgaris TaxID=2600176 RepID=A0A5C6X4Y0_9DELT|nr:hypothetical protein [Lujinxingia vulgaris]TXD34660.1 hypothetical protein FRC96_13690 [Lujinxingia vulgaris]
MTDPHQALHAYLERVIALRDAHERSLDHDELRQVAREVGLSDADVERAARAAADHLERARGFVDHRLFDEAIAELQHACVLVPDDPQILHRLASAYAARWERDQNPADLREAMARCKAVVTIDPGHSAAYELLGRLNAQTPQTPTASSPRVVFFALALVVLIAAGAGAFFIIAQDSPAQSADPQARSGHPPATKTLLNAPPAPRSAQGQPVETSGNIEVRLVLASELPPVTLSHVHAEFNTYPNGSFFKLNGLFAHERSELELHEVQARLQGFNEAGAPLGEPMPLAIKPSYMPALRPGDALAFRHQMATAAELASVEIRIESVKTQPAPSSYSPSPAIEATVQPGPDGMTPELTFRERRFEITTNELLDRRSMRLHLEVENTGTHLVELVRLRVDLINEAGEVVDERLSYLTSSGYPAFAPGQTRLGAILVADLAKSVADYRVSVVEWR